MSCARGLAIGLDGLEVTLADRLMAAGDMLVVWRGIVVALEHPRLGLIGPVPLRRTGGHTGPHGMAYIAAPGFEPGDRGVRSAFDVVPTLARLLGAPTSPRLSGEVLR
jgi:hypothetical protein